MTVTLMRRVGTRQLELEEMIVLDSTGRIYLTEEFMVVVCDAFVSKGLH